MRRLAVLATAAALAAAPVLRPPPVAAGAVSYRPPVDGPVVDGFREPAGPYARGNRGIDYATTPGGPVRASAHGEVTFAGQVGGRLHVVVLHPDGIRTSYSFLRRVAVRRGDRVRQGQAVGTSGSTLHFGARVGDTYIDPTTLFDGGPPVVHLVPDGAGPRASEAGERAALASAFAARGRPSESDAPGWGWARSAGDWLGDRFVGRAAPAAAWGRRALAAAVRGGWGALRAGAPAGGLLARPLALGLHTVGGLDAWWRQRGRCTPAGVPPPAPQGRRRVVLVGGLGSSSRRAAIDDLDVASLGYAPADVARFSYRAGTVADAPYGPADTTIDLRIAARRLRELLARLEADEPGVPVDVVAHSQGGLVARLAVALEHDEADPRLPAVATLVTLGTPHRGADLATALAGIRGTVGGGLGVAAYGHLAGGVDPAGPSLDQLAEGSSFLRDLHARPLPAGIRFTSVGARGDLVVPAGRSLAPGSRHVVVSVPGALGDHARLPASPAARREVALAVAGAPPTCQSVGDVLLDRLTGGSVSLGEDLFGAGLRTALAPVDPRPALAGGRS